MFVILQNRIFNTVKSDASLRELTPLAALFTLYRMKDIYNEINDVAHGTATRKNGVVMAVRVYLQSLMKNNRRRYVSNTGAVSLTEAVS